MLQVEYTHQTTFGAIKVKSLIGHEYGSKVQLSKGYAYILQMNSELWTLNLPHRTQILYTPDISMILMQLEIKPSSIVIEVSFSYFVIKLINKMINIFRQELDLDHCHTIF